MSRVIVSLRFIYILLLLSIVGSTFILTSCNTVKRIDIPLLNKSASSEREQIISVLDSVERLVERKQLRKAMDYISLDYRDEQNRKYNDIREYLQGIIRDYRVIRITRATPEINIEGNKATVIDTFGTIAEPFDPVQGVPVNIQGKVIITLQKESDGWKIISWSPLL
ncbi:MAG: nuclear transport factor 2 family protein [Candidatus Hydrogenedens sp.]|nr:nuclear transport factor 2 family protein [Candidatus Hydrogenedens sp.]